MTFGKYLEQFTPEDVAGKLARVTVNDVTKTLAKEGLDALDLLHLLAAPAADFLEEMAQKAQRLTRQHFGNTVGLYAPLYISDYCTNHCTYCGFNCSTGFNRTKLTMAEIEEEAREIHAMGIRHVLMLTGEAPEKTPMVYLEEAVALLKNYFSSIALEIMPMTEEEYRRLIRAGADSLTVYQETYNQKIYAEVHPRGRKSDFHYRLETPERGARAGFRGMNIGPLFGLADPRVEAFLAGMHARYLEQEYADVEISLSLPRMTRAQGGIDARHVLDDRTFVQVMTAWRLFMPRLGITISTRESADFRDRLIFLGATRYSAGSRTDVGGYSSTSVDSTVQFEVTDTRSVEQVSEMIRQSGYQPVFKDWENLV